jgi:hypothetical protein
VKYFTLSPLPLETLLPFPRGKGLWRVQNFVPLPLPLHTLGLYPQGFVNPWHSLVLTQGAECKGDRAVAQLNVAGLPHDAVCVGDGEVGEAAVILLKAIRALHVGFAQHLSAKLVSSFKLRSWATSLLASRCWNVWPMAVLARPMAMVRRVWGSRLVQAWRMLIDDWGERG